MRVLTSLDPRALLNQALSEIQEFTDLEPQRRAYLIVPEGLKAEAERRYLEKFSPSGLMMAEVLSFRRLSERLLMAVGAPGKSLSPFAELLNLRRLIQKSPERYPKLSRMSWSSHNLTEILAVLGDFKRQGVAADALLEISRTVPLASSQANLMEVSNLYGDYLEALAERQSYALSDLISLMAERILVPEESIKRASAFLETATFWLVGYGDLRLLTQAELLMIRALLKRGATIHFALPLAEPGAEIVTGSSQLAEETLRQLYELVGEEGLDFALIPDERNPAAVALSDYLVENPQEFKAAGGRAGARPFDYGLISAPDRFMAADFLAGEIKRLVLSGVRRKRIAVAVLDPRDERLLRQVFHDFELETDLSLPIALQDSALYRYLRGLFAIQAGERRVRDILATLRSVLRPEELSLEAIDRLENLALAQGWRYWSELKSGLDTTLSDLEQAATLIDALIETLAALPTEGTGAELVSAWQTVLNTDLRSYTALERYLEREPQSETAAVLARAWQALGQIFSEIASLETGERLRAEAFYELILSALSMSLPPTIPQGLDRVHLLPLRALLQKEVDYLFLFNSSVESLPPPPPAEGLLNSAEREWLKRELGQNFPNFRADLPASHHYLLSQIFALPERALVFYHCGPLTQDGEGYKSERLSPAEVRLLKLPGVTVQILQADDLPDQRALGRSSSRRLLALYKKQWPEAVHAAWQPIQTEAELNERTVTAEPSLNKTGEILLGEEALSSFVSEGLSWSASSLETLAACPYQAFMNHIIQGKERYEAQPDPRQIGTFVHRLLELLGPELSAIAEELQAVAAEDLETQQQWREAKIGREILEPLYRQVAQEPGFELWMRPEVYGHEGLRLKRNLIDFVALLAKNKNEGYELWRQEWRFPGEGEAVTLPFSYRGEERRLELRGIIDRVDALLEEGVPEALALYDYKTGMTESQEKNLEVGLELQLPLYIYACQQMMPELPVMEAKLLNLRDERPHVAALSAKSLVEPALKTSGVKGSYSSEKLASRGAELASASLTEFYGGDISARPRLSEKASQSEALPCQYCPYKASCGYDRRQIRRRVEILRAATDEEKLQDGQNEEETV